MLLKLLIVFGIAFLLLLTGKLVQSKFYKIITLLPLSLFVIFLTYLPEVSLGKNYFFANDWIPTLGVSLDFKLDGLSLLFSLLITGIGSLIFFYASYYLKGHRYLHRFYCYLTLFMGAMLGLVLSDNVLSIFTFWELTSITSFFLIGFNNEEEGSRRSAIMALSITGIGGFLLLAGFVLMGQITGTYSVREMLGSAEILQNHSFYILILILVFAGAFTKSAQFPFHFWLPGAMQAPTPISAYLHSATMVKAGIYIIARLTPVLSDNCIWNTTLIYAGGITMLFGAFHSIFRIDMKAVLAYSTISALGIIVFLLGIGTEHAIFAAMAFIVVHALYKAALFLVTGIVDHAVHTRDLTKLGGLAKYMPLVAIAGFIAALSSAGVPLTFGFISKDLVYEAALHNSYEWQIGLTAAAVITNILLACSGFMAGIKPFFGKLPESINPVKIHKPSFFLWFPVLILTLHTLLFGIFPSIADLSLIRPAVKSIGIYSPVLSLKIWHGFNLVLLLSGITIAAGVILYLVKKFSPKSLEYVESYNFLAPKNITENFGEWVRKIAFIYTRLLHNGYLRAYILVIIVFLTLLVGYRLFTTVSLSININDLSEITIYEATIFIIILVSIFFTAHTSSRLTAIASLGIIGYCICLIFVFYGAPDLAMTQFTIDTLTVVLFVLVLFKLPPFLSFQNRRILYRDAVVAACFGVLISIITLQALISPAVKETSKFYADYVYTLAKGKNVVNVILVDFRGFDTLIETIVLSIAALGVYSLLKYKITNEERD